MLDFNELRLESDDEARLKRLAIVLTAQLPSNSDQAMYVMQTVMGLIGSYRPRHQDGLVCRYPKGNCCFLIKTPRPTAAQER